DASTRASASATKLRGLGRLASAAVMTSSGSAAPSREEKETPSSLGATSAKLTLPFPVTSEVTSYSTQLPALTPPEVAMGVPARLGRVSQVMPVSVQLPVTP